MSEPEAGFIRLEVSDVAVERWLASPVASATEWTDWRKMPGAWYGDDGAPVTMQTVSDAELAGMLADADDGLQRSATTGEALAGLMQYVEEPFLRVQQYDAASRTFTAGTLTYSENFTEFLKFLTLARSAARFLQPGDSGLVVIEDYVWGNEGEEPMALRLFPSGVSEWVDEDGMEEAVESFRKLANGMIKQWGPEAVL